MSIGIIPLVLHSFKRNTDYMGYINCVMVIFTDISTAYFLLTTTPHHPLYIPLYNPSPLYDPSPPYRNDLLLLPHNGYG